MRSVILLLAQQMLNKPVRAGWIVIIARMVILDTARRTVTLLNYEVTSVWGH